MAGSAGDHRSRSIQFWGIAAGLAALVAAGCYSGTALVTGDNAWVLVGLGSLFGLLGLVSFGLSAAAYLGGRPRPDRPILKISSGEGDQAVIWEQNEPTKGLEMWEEATKVVGDPPPGGVPEMPKDLHWVCKSSLLKVENTSKTEEARRTRVQVGATSPRAIDTSVLGGGGWPEGMVLREPLPVALKWAHTDAEEIDLPAGGVAFAVFERHYLGLDSTGKTSWQLWDFPVDGWKGTLGGKKVDAWGFKVNAWCEGHPPVSEIFAYQLNTTEEPEPGR
jgi:hypothetical protein